MAIKRACHMALLLFLKQEKFNCLSTKLKLHKDTKMSLFVAGLMLSIKQVNNKNKIMQNA